MSEWREVFGYPDYEVSEHGIVRRCKRDKANRIMSPIIKPCLRPDGYYTVSLHRDTKQKSHLVHRVVCRAFHGEAPTERHQVAHIDGDKSNNHASNLRWSTPSENSYDKNRHGTMRVGDNHHSRYNPDCLPRGEKHKNSKLNDDLVRKIRNDSRSQSTIAKEIGVSQTLIGLVKRREIWKHVKEV